MATNQLNRHDLNRTAPPALLKWIGSKQSIAEIIVNYMPQEFNTYIEPFLGGGAVLGTLGPCNAIAGDNLKPLVEIWQLLQDNPESLLAHYKETWDKYIEKPEETYEKIRTNYNQTPNPYDLLFISRACYGGVIRFTKTGTLSTPIGMQTPISPKTLSERINLWRRRVKGAKFILADFSETMEFASKGDLVYCDPPYQYCQQIIYGSQSFRISGLWTAIQKCKERGAKVVLSLDGKIKSEQVELRHNFPMGLFEQEVFIPRGSSMLRRFQKKGAKMVGEDVQDRLLLTWS